MRRFTLIVTVVALGLVLVPSPATATATATPAAPTETTVSELDLSGVRTSAIADLPAVAPVPDETAAPAPTPSSPPPDATAPTAPTDPGPTTTAPGPQATAAAPDPDVLTTTIDTAPFTVFGITWDPGPDGVVIRYRVRESGTWSDWQATGASDAVPDSNRAEAADPTTRGGTDPIVASHADGVQLWAEASSGTVTGLKVVLIDPGTRAGDAAPQQATIATAAARQPRQSPTITSAVFRQSSSSVRTVAAAPNQPAIISRAGWGADESMRTCDPDYSTQMVSAAVHHTASANSYAPADVPAIIRGFYAYHTRSEADGGRGWCDIGYNFLVDRFGRIFEGRAGGIASTVVGVHTGGFNSRTIGIAAIGDYSAAAVPAELTESLSQLIAWKFSIHHITAGATVQMVSGGGASKYPLGAVVDFPTIYGHRDAQLTACPGQALYDLLPAIRARVAELSNESVTFSPVGAIDAMSGTATGVRVAGWAFDPETSTPIQLEVTVDGTASVLRADQDRADIGAAFPGIGSQHGFKATVPVAGGRHVVCLRAINVGQGASTVLGCSVVTVSNSAPVGLIDGVTATPTTISVNGWSFDPDTAEPIAVHVYVDGAGLAVLANASRPDIGAAYNRGDLHGFNVTIPVASGTHQVCAYGIDSQGGANTLLGCRSVTAGTGSRPPLGVVDVVGDGGANTVHVAGWALDPDVSSSIAVHVYVDGVGVAVAASGVRADIGAAFGRGSAHGFDAVLPASTGVHTVCVYGIDASGGPNTLLGCSAVSVVNRVPFGSIDVAAAAGPNAIQVAGWAVDQDVWRPIAVHVYVDGVGVALTAGNARADVDAVYGRGADHGYGVTVPASGGTHTVCVYAIDATGGPNAVLGCRTVSLVDHAPVGTIDVVRDTGQSSIQVAGWAFDPDVSDPIAVHVYIDGAGVAVSAANPRADVDAVYQHGANHGYDATFPVAAGTHSVCAYGIDANGTANALLGCRTVSVGNTLPVGVIDVVEDAGSGSLHVAGWALDPDTWSPIAVHVYIDGAGVAVSAANPRPDVDAVYARGANHGFDVLVPAAAGAHTVCVYAIDATGGPNALLGCRTATTT